MRLLSPSCVRQRRGCFIHGKGFDVLFSQIAGLFHFRFARGEHPHLALSQRFCVGLNEPYFASEAIHFVGGVDGSARRSDRVHSAKQESDQEHQHSAGTGPHEFFGRIEFISDPPGRQNQKLIFTALALQPLNILLVAVDLGLIAIDLLLLLVVGDLMTLQLVANQSSCA